MTSIRQALNVEDVRTIARHRLPRAIFEVIEGGHGEETTLAANRADLNRIKLIPRNLEDASFPDLSTTLLGREVAMPFMLAPCSFGRIADPEAERAVARAASNFGIGYIMPGAASESIERVAEGQFLGIVANRVCFRSVS
ncbi:alpha-hydroxy-acid oxidizing protein [Cryobacterium sp. TMS1-20-1]|uniref:alpha-hydroxy acid oxidase n=1 Tax=Cryobacterium sp. TMS1-20-1 TaxID=1259223 RepID=UPI00141BCC61|nr:alpha-hydroxy-acid oxidizing protein [Cryobacterium sp. TMS1-20-1]